MSELEQLRDVLPEDMIAAWPHVARAVPEDGILMGGTALTVHLRHRISRDLDVFTTADFDPEQIAGRLTKAGPFAPTSVDEGTLNGVFSKTKVQVLWAKDQTVLEPAQPVAGLPVGSLSDIFATKLKVIGDRGELRDYFDLMRIEVDTGRMVEEGIQLLRARFGDRRSEVTVEAVVRALGYFDDVISDPYLSATYGTDVKDEVAAYWTGRQPAIVTSLDARAAVTPPPSGHPLRDDPDGSPDT